MADALAPDIPTIGETLRAWRTFRGLSSTELAGKAGVRIAYLSEIEHNRTANPRPKYLEKLAAALAVPVLDILARKMPHDREIHDVQQLTSVTTTQHKEADGARLQGVDFSFASPLKSAARLSEKEQLRRILGHVDELRTMIETLIEERG
jgi:transcriptional regulator with XRE-family HTH domain